jgi:hypothetical protein
VAGFVPLPGPIGAQSSAGQAREALFLSLACLAGCSLLFVAILHTGAARQFVLLRLQAVTGKAGISVTAAGLDHDLFSGRLWLQDSSVRSTRISQLSVAVTARRSAAKIPLRSLVFGSF